MLLQNQDSVVISTSAALGSGGTDCSDSILNGHDAVIFYIIIEMSKIIVIIHIFLHSNCFFF